MRKKKVKNQDSMSKTNFFFSTLSFSPWAILATWMYVGAPQNIHEKKEEFKTRLNKNSPHAYAKSKFDILGVPGKLLKHVIHSSKSKN
jgi:hypothetical protein